MAEPHWTPGPWRVDTHDFPALFPLVRLGPDCGGKGAICINEGPSPEQVSKGEFRGTTMPTALANAHLIASAPDLYAALERLLQSNRPDAVEAAVAALAAARGETP